MKVEELKMEREKARELYQKYQSHRAHQTPADAEISAIYKRISQGHTVIRALESIRTAGMNVEGLPKLAIMRSDVPLCYAHFEQDAILMSEHRNSWRHTRAAPSKNIKIDWSGVKKPNDGRHIYEAQVPLIPVHLRPRRGIQNYHILWEAEWSKRYPVDPYLLRRFGGDAWLVCASWDLTEAERAVMSSRLRH